MTEHKNDSLQYLHRHILQATTTDELLDEILRRKEEFDGADVLLDLLVERGILGYEDEDNDLGLYRKL